MAVRTHVWLVLLEQRTYPTWRAEVGAETFDEATEIFKAWLVQNEPRFSEEAIRTVNGDHVGTCFGKGVIEVMNVEG